MSPSFMFLLSNYYFQSLLLIIIPGCSSYTKMNELQEKGDKSDEIKFVYNLRNYLSLKI